MSSPVCQPGEDRLLVRNGWKVYRRSFSVAEARWGLLVGLALCAIAAWVSYRGARPDPSLTADVTLAAAAPAQSRGALPSELTAPGWREGAASQFGPDNLYEKINGRADYFKSFGFVRLDTVSIGMASKEDGATGAIDIEMYHLGSSANALGAYNGERQPGAAVERQAGGMSHISRNALYLAQGQFYIRAIGSDESEPVRTQLDFLRERFRTVLVGEELPWSYALFTDALGLSADRIAYAAENAFSFGFARDVWSARLADDQTQLFVAVRADADAAHALAARFVGAFAGYGEAASPIDGVTWVADEFIGSFATAVADGSWVLGVRGAVDLATGKAALAELRKAVATLPETIRSRARAAAPSAPAGSPDSGRGEDSDNTEPADDAYDEAH